MASDNSLIVLDLPTFRQKRPRGIVTGGICFRFEGGVFPEAGWSDFPVAVLVDWTDAWMQLVQVASRRDVTWRFMDGPHSLTVSRIDRTVSSGAFEFSRVHESLLEAAGEVLTYCDANQLGCRDLEVLREQTQRMGMIRGADRIGAGKIAYFEARTKVTMMPKR
jgi:hypothetical protein